MFDLRALDDELNHLILTGKAMAAFEKFYAEDCVMQEPNAPACVGKDANRKREQEVLDAVEAFHDAKLVASAVGDGVSFSEWFMEVTMKGAGRVKMEQIARRLWRDGKVVDERFYYNRG